MKLLSSLLLIVFLFFSQIFAFSQSPDLINYQAVARDLSGNPLVSTPVNVTYDIRQSSSSGPVVYSETHSLNTNQFGLFAAEIGGGTPVSGTFAGINWSTGLYYLQVTVNGDVMPATQLLSVPYALHANTATSGTPGANGHTNLADSVSEPAGSNCANGGYLIHMGADDNDDGILQPIERDISYYICNGLDGSANNNDTSATNELQTLSISNDTIFLTNGGFVVLPSASVDSDWQVNGNDMNSIPSGNVGIGTTSPTQKLTVSSSDSVISSFIGTNPNLSAISVANINPNAATGAVFLTATDTGLIAMDPTLNTFFLTNSTPNGHIALTADSAVASYADFITHSGVSLLNRVDSIYNFSVNPNGVFHVNQGTFVTDSLYVVGSNLTNPGWILANDGFGQAVWTNPSSIGSSNWNINGSGIDYTAGNVGIGTTNPTSTLTINSVVGNDIEFVGGSNADIYSNSQIFMSSFSSTHIDATEIRLGTASLDRLTIVNNGNIGVGTITPQQLFTLSTPASTTLRMERTNTAAFDWEMNVDNLGFHIKGGADAVGPGLIDFVNVDGNGRMGLGITTPTQKLHVFGGTIRIDDGSNPYNLPVSDGSNGQVLTTNGAGITSWQSLSGGGNDTALIDADGDTRIQVESAPDQDVIHFNLGNSTGYTAAEYFTMIGPRLEVINSGGSIFFGEKAGDNDNLGNNQNVFIGSFSGRFNTSGQFNTAIGHNSLNANTIGNHNTALGKNSLVSNTSGNANTSLGSHALAANQAGNLNVAVGRQALNVNTTGSANVAIGYQSLVSATNADNNVGVGSEALRSNNTGASNVAIGRRALYSKTSGGGNVVIGSSAGHNNLTGSGNIFIGNNSGQSEMGSDKLYIENTNSSTPLIWGDFANDSLKVNGFLSVIDGTQGAGKVLTSDASGNAAWKAKRIAFEAEMSNSFSLTIGSFGSGSVKVPFDIEIFDEGAIYDPSATSFEFTAPVSGVYAIETSVTFSHVGGGKVICSLALVKNGMSNTPMKTSSAVIDQPGELQTATINSTVRLSAGDKITVETVMNTSSAINIQPSPINKNWFSGHLVYEL